MKWVLRVATVCLVASLLCWGTWQIGSAIEPPTVIVDDNGTADYTTINAAIADVEPGTIIQIKAGTYAETVRITQRVHLVGENRATTVIAPPAGDGIVVTADGLDAANRLLISGLSLTGNLGGAGVKVEGGRDYLTLSNLTIRTFNTGVLCEGLAGNTDPLLDVQQDLRIDNCLLTTNLNAGLKISQSLPAMTDLTVSASQFDYNYFGICANAAAGATHLENVTIQGCIFSNNSANGALFERLSDSTISAVQFSGNGSLTNSGNNQSGLLLNLKYGTYHQITLTDITASTNGVNDLTTGAGLAIITGTNGATASLSGLQLSATTVSGSPTALRLMGNLSDIHLTGMQFNGTGTGLAATFTSTGQSLPLGTCRFAASLAPSIRIGAALAVDATQATFVNAADNYAIEDRIMHGLDAGGAGLVTWVPNTVFVTPNSGSVNRGISAVSAGGTVQVAAGTFPAPVNITKSLTVRGQQQNVLPAEQPETERTTLGPVTLTPAATSVTLNGCRLLRTSPTVAPISCAAFTSTFTLAYSVIEGGMALEGLAGANVHLQHNAITQSADNGLELGHTQIGALTLTANTFTANAQAGLCLTGAGLSIAGPIVLTDNMYVNNGIGLRLESTGASAGLAQLTLGSSIFTNNSVSDIALAANAQTAVDATAVTFTGATSRPEKEARVFHYIDDTTLGLVNFGGEVTAVSMTDLSAPSQGVCLLSAQLTPPLAGETIAFKVENNEPFLAATDEEGRATFSMPVMPEIFTVGSTYPVLATFAGNDTHWPSTTSASLLVTASQTPQAVWVNALWAAESTGTALPVEGAPGGYAYVGYNAFATIAPAVTAVATGGTVNIAAGTFTGPLTIAKRITLAGAGRENTTLALAGTSGQVLTLTAGGTATDERLVVRNLRLQGGSSGIYTNTAISHVTLEHLTIAGAANYGVEIHNDAVVTDLHMADCYLQQNTTGMRVRGSLTGLTMTFCVFTENSYGLQSYRYANEPAKPFTQVLLDNCAFSNNRAKGIYLEKLDQATFRNVIVNQCGNDPSASSQMGIDLNLKYADYADITLDNCAILDCAQANPYGAGLAINARASTSNYGTYPATLTGITVRGGQISGSPIGVCVGSANDASLSNVVISTHFADFAFPRQAIVGISPIIVDARAATFSNATTPMQKEALIYHKLDRPDFGIVRYADVEPAVTLAAAAGTQFSEVTLQATVTTNGGAFADIPVQFTLNGNVVGTATTNASGVAALPLTLTHTPGTYPLRADVLVTDAYGWAMDTETLLVSSAVTPHEVWVDSAWSGKVADELVILPGSPAKHLYFGHNAFASIQAAVDHVTATGLIHVLAGDYLEGVTIDKPLSLVGNLTEPTSVSLRGRVAVNDQYAGIVVTSADVAISGIQIIGDAAVPAQYGIFAACPGELSISHTQISGIAGGAGTQAGAGIFVPGQAGHCAELTLTANLITQTAGAGICIGTPDAPVACTTLSLCENTLDDVCGESTDDVAGAITVFGLESGVITGNRVTSRRDGLVLVAGPAFASADVACRENVLDGTGCGLYLIGLSGAATLSLGNTEFSDDLTEFIHLFHDPQTPARSTTLSLDATQARFGTTTMPSVLEAKLYDQVDESTLGRVNYFGTVPIANDDALTILQNSVNTRVDVLGNDEDLEGYLELTGVSPGGHGTFTVTDDRTALLYTPSVAYFGPDEATYTIFDGAASVTATVRVQVVGVKPNAAIRVTNGALIGAQMINATGDGQVCAETVSAGTAAHYDIVIRNEGNYPDALDVNIDTTAAAGWTINAWCDTSTPTNITLPVTTNWWTSPLPIAPGDSLILRLDVTPGQVPDGGSLLSVPIRVRSHSFQSQLDVVKAAVTKAPAYQPDLLIGLEPEGPFMGAGVINETGAEQTSARSGILAYRPAEFIVRLVNDGNMVDTMTVQIPPVASGWQVTVIDGPTGTQDVTAQVTTGMAVTLGRNQMRQLRLRITPGASLAPGTVLEVPIRVSSTHDATALDVVKATVRTVGSTVRVSVNNQGIQGAKESYTYGPVTSGDGMLIAFASASPFVDSDTNNRNDVYVYNLQTFSIERVSVSSAGVQGNGDSGVRGVALSNDGRYVAFRSSASNLVPGDTNGKWDIFLYDRQLHTTMRVSAGTRQASRDCGYYGMAISGDGTHVAFETPAALDSSDTNGLSDIYVWSRMTGSLTLASVSVAGTAALGTSLAPALSTDGRMLAFASTAPTLVPDDTNGKRDVFLRDLTTGQMRLVSVTATGVPANADSTNPALATVGTELVITFESLATNLVADDTNAASDIFVKTFPTGALQRLSIAADTRQGNSSSLAPAISGNGRFIAFRSFATNLVVSDTNGRWDVFVADRQSGKVRHRVSVAADGTQANDNSGINGLSISDDGVLVAYNSQASNLVENDTNAEYDVFVTSRAFVDYPPVAAVTLTATPGTLQLLGTTILLQANATGGNQVQYWFRARRRAPGTTTWEAWETLQLFSGARECRWTPTLPGLYSVIAYAREAGTTTPMPYKAITVTIK
jgi:hypothetical protein